MSAFYHWKADRRPEELGRRSAFRAAANTWVTAAYGCFLTGPVNTFVLDGKPVAKLRVTPTQQRLGGDGLCRISEIEVRAK